MTGGPPVGDRPASRAGGWLPTPGVVAVAAVSALVTAVVSVAVTLAVVRDAAGPAVSSGPAATGSVAGAATGLPELVAGLSSGVVRIETTACSEGSVGTGFLVGPTLVATVAHVVAGAHKIVLTAGGDAVPGTVVGLDAATDLALVRADRPLAGHVFALAGSPPRVGAEVVGLGYPLGGGLSLVHAVVSGVDRSMTVSSGSAAAAASSGSAAEPSPAAPPTTIEHLIQVNGVFTAGDSGGPLVAGDGSVVGLVEARATEVPGIGFAVAAPTADAAYRRWRADPRPVQVSGDCSAPVGPPDAVAQVRDVSGSPDGPAVQALLGRFATALNAGRYGEAFALFTPTAQHRTTVQAWTAEERSSRLFDITVHQIVAVPPGSPAAGPPTPSGSPSDSGSPGASPSTGAGPSTGPGPATGSGPATGPANGSATGPGQRSLRAEITFTSVQDAALGPRGQVCSLWHLTYLLVQVEGSWRIDRAVQQPGSPQAC